MAYKKLFDKFNSATTKEWEEKINIDLKGADYKKKLIAKTIEGIDIKPYYRTEDLSDLEYLSSLPGKYPYSRGNNTENSKHKIRQNIFIDKYKNANKKAVEIVSKGVTSVGFIIDHKEDISKKELSVLLKDIDVSNIEINFISGIHSEKVFQLFKNYILSNNIDSDTITGSVGFDPIGHKTVTGNCYNKNNCNFSDKLKSLIKISENYLPKFKIININAQHFRNAGSTAVQELAFGLAIGSEYMAKANDAGIKTDLIASKIMFTFGIASNYFMEIAKIRAARILWAKIVDAFKVKNKENCKTYIHSVTCNWNKTAYAPYVNMLRTTTESMSALLGGTDSLLVSPFNATFEKPDDFSERIARNTQIILNEEAYFDKPVDPAGGSYYIENLTNSIAEYAWKLFLEIEQEGGYEKAFNKGIIKEKIENTARQRDMNIAQRKEIILGTNQYPDRNEKITIPKKEKRTIPENALRLYRAAEAFESLRQKTEKAKKTPKVFMLTIGNSVMRKARATFAGNFFACAGFKIIDKSGFNTIEDAVQASIKANADITVICSSDDEYPDIVPVIFERLKNKSIVAVAGYPKNSIDALSAFGVKHFIHLKSNILETLKEFQEELGIK
ncbi:MAG: acyl-CoA mutase large subunit family protein [Bacteroidales bacterium]|nr:acyl-CoA mutase large subunit family protein [Bacteroidales bacterium]